MRFSPQKHGTASLKRNWDYRCCEYYFIKGVIYPYLIDYTHVTVKEKAGQSLTWRVTRATRAPSEYAVAEYNGSVNATCSKQ